MLGYPSPPELHPYVTTCLTELTGSRPGVPSSAAGRSTFVDCCFRTVTEPSVLESDLGARAVPLWQHPSKQQAPVLVRAFRPFNSVETTRQRYCSTLAVLVPRRRAYGVPGLVHLPLQLLIDPILRLGTVVATFIRNQTYSVLRPPQTSRRWCPGPQ